MPRARRRDGYTNRSDLIASPRPLAPTAAPNQTYGEAGAQLAAQQSVPMVAGPLMPLSAPSARPSEPVQAGLKVGPGPGPDVLGPMMMPDDSLADLRAIATAFPDPTLAALLAEAEEGVDF